MKCAASIVGLLAVTVIVGCADQPQGRLLADVAVLTSPNPWPTPQRISGGAPRVQALWMNETTIPSGTDWIGRAVTSTNVASLEIRTESSSFIAERTAFGEFTFRQHVLDLVPQYKRGYLLQVIARNAAGEQDTVLVPIRYR